MISATGCAHDDHEPVPACAVHPGHQLLGLFLPSEEHCRFLGGVGIEAWIGSAGRIPPAGEAARVLRSYGQHGGGDEYQQQDDHRGAGILLDQTQCEWRRRLVCGVVGRDPE